MKVLIGIIVIIALGYILYDAGLIDSSHFAAIKDTLKGYYTNTKNYITS